MAGLKRKFAGIFLLFTVTIGSLAAQGQQASVSDPELEKFATVFQQLRMMDQEVRRKMASTVAGKEMEVKRFNEIHRAKMNPEIEAELSEAEKKEYKEIIAEIETVNADFKKKVEVAIKEAGLSINRYQQIAEQLQQDPKLQKRLKTTLKQ